MPAGDFEALLIVDLGDTRLRAAILDPYGGFLHRTSATTPRDDPSALERVMRENIEASRFPLAGAVVGVPGPVSYLDGIPLSLPNLPAWDGHIDAGVLARRLGLPVAVAHDADLAALGEHRFGAGRGTLNLVYVTVSTGVGAGVVLGGRLAHGRRSIVEVGHTLIDLESGATLEELANGAALARLAGVPGPEATRRAALGDAAALEAFERVGRALGAGILNLALLFGPERVVVGGSVAHAGERLLAPVRAYLEEMGPPRGVTVEVVRSALGDDAGLRGGVAFWNDLHAPRTDTSPFLARPE
ncbi:MAG: ROK family protein [Dehalococcoidia bacterium]|nr:ROK family protein [Dehalococcoidia bacterium]